MKEIWREVPGFEGIYKISNLGRIFVYPTHHPLGYGRHHNGRFAVHSKSPAGYPTLDAKRTGRPRKTILIHKLIAQLFIPNPHNHGIVNHKDGDKSNYNLVNLEHVSKREDCLHVYRTGLRVVTEKQRRALTGGRLKAIQNRKKEKS